LQRRTGRIPGLAAVLVGDDPASATYVRTKTRACQEVGIASRQLTPPRDTGQSDLVALIHVADVFANRMAEQPNEPDKGVDFDQDALVRVKLNDPNLVNEYIANYAAVVHSDVEAVTQFDMPR